jgi:hypothetical protein
LVTTVTLAPISPGNAGYPLTIVTSLPRSTDNFAVYPLSTFSAVRMVFLVNFKHQTDDGFWETSGLLLLLGSSIFKPAFSFLFV